MVPIFWCLNLKVLLPAEFTSGYEMVSDFIVLFWRIFTYNWRPFMSEYLYSHQTYRDSVSCQHTYFESFWEISMFEWNIISSLNFHKFYGKLKANEQNFNMSFCHMLLQVIEGKHEGLWIPGKVTTKKSFISTIIMLLFMVTYVSLLINQ